jgi:hypothetical protein
MLANYCRPICLDSRKGRQLVPVTELIWQPAVSRPIKALGRPVGPPAVAHDEIATAWDAFIILIAYHAQRVGVFQPGFWAVRSIRRHRHADRSRTLDRNGGAAYAIQLAFGNVDILPPLKAG